jgi:hypothetical protein
MRGEDGGFFFKGEWDGKRCVRYLGAVEQRGRERGILEREVEVKKKLDTRD